jgi:hypothetical protein
MTERAFSGAFPHQHGDPRGLIERIHAQLRERIEEAVEMAALELLVKLREAHGQPAPDSASAADRREFERTSRELLAYLHDAFAAELTSEQRGASERTQAEARHDQPLIAVQALLARRLPDYWQRFERHRAAYAQARIDAPAARAGWFDRLRHRGGS